MQKEEDLARGEMKPAGPRVGGLGMEKGLLFLWVLDNSSENGWYRQKYFEKSGRGCWSWMFFYLLSEAGIRAICQERGEIGK